MNLRIYTDGAARGNPGPAGIGIAIYNDSNELLEEYREYLGEATNNVAEYRALLQALTLAKKYLPCSVTVHSDSELMVRQMLGIYKVKNEVLREFFMNAQQSARCFERVHFKHIPREENRVADLLANQAINTGHATQGFQAG